MSLRRLGDLLALLGFITTAVAYAWYHGFYSQVRDILGVRGELPIECLYQMSGPCRLPAMLAKQLGQQGYEPILFWIGFSVLALGLSLIAFCQEEPISHGYSDKAPKKRIEPTL